MLTLPPPNAVTAVVKCVEPVSKLRVTSPETPPPLKPNPAPTAVISPPPEDTIASFTAAAVGTTVESPNIELVTLKKAAVPREPVCVANWSSLVFIEPVEVDNWSNLSVCVVLVVSLLAVYEFSDVFELDAVNEFNEVFRTSSSKYCLSIAVPSQTPVPIVPTVVIADCKKCSPAT